MHHVTTWDLDVDDDEDGARVVVEVGEQLELAVLDDGAGAFLFLWRDSLGAVLALALPATC